MTSETKMPEDESKLPTGPHALALSRSLLKESNDLRYSTLTIDDRDDGYAQALRDVSPRIAEAYEKDAGVVARLRERLEDLVDQADAMAGGDMAPGDWTLLTESIQESRELLSETKPPGRARTSKAKASHAIKEHLQMMLELEADGLPCFDMVEDGEASWAFWILESDTTSYVHHDLAIEWYGTTWHPRKEPESETAF